MPADAPSTEPSALNSLIAPEVHQDEFAEAIRNLARSALIDTVLEIGSSSGEGSTRAWVEGLRLNPRKPRLYCMEVSRVRCEALKQYWKSADFIECFLGSSVGLGQFPSPADVEGFHRTVPGPLQKYPLHEVLGWLQADLDYIRNEGVPTDCIREIKRTRGIENFGAVLIDGSEFTGNAELDEVYGAEFILLDDTQTYKCHAAHQRLMHDPGYDLIAENPKLRHGYSIFRRKRRTPVDPLPTDVPVHYFTIVLNGDPFIRHHIEVLRRLPFRWCWHIVEGAATLSHDTAWSVASGGVLPEDLHHSGLSMDGTSAYLDELAAKFPGQITVYRKAGGQLWDGKIEMVAEPLKHIYEDAILWQIDADELWTVRQLVEGRAMFMRSPEKAAAWFWCHFFVGEKLVVSSRNCYSQNPSQEWLRAWSYRPGMRWLAHEPPMLAERTDAGDWRTVSGRRDFTHAETEEAGLVFQHFAYVTEAQMAFKERYYGYAGALSSWRKLQDASHFPILLREALPWVADDAYADTMEARGIKPLAVRDTAGHWHFSTDLGESGAPGRTPSTIVVDGIYFQFNNTGIARVWQEILKEWASSGVARDVWVLDRGGTAPVITGIRTRRIPLYDPQNPGADALMLQRYCDELDAGIFISTYYTSAIATPTVVMIHDMIPELLGDTLEGWAWRQKDLALQHARRIVCVSESTARDVSRLVPGNPGSRTVVTLLAAAPVFAPCTNAEIADFRERHLLPKDYLLIAGERIGIHIGTQGYKNAALAFRAWSLLPEEERATLTILCAGGRPELEKPLRILAREASVRVIRFSDEDLRRAYAGAVALVYPSLYEGFGLPVLEAMACGCPAITCSRASLGEVAGGAACFVNPWDAAQTANAIHTLRSNAVERAKHVSLGLAQAARFSFPKMAAQLAGVLQEAAQEGAVFHDSPASHAWEKLRQIQAEQSKLAASLNAQAAELKEARKVAKQAQKTVQKVEKHLREEQQKRRKPFKRLWDKLTGKPSNVPRKTR